jgi:hypothetical protein
VDLVWKGDSLTVPRAGIETSCLGQADDVQASHVVKGQRRPTSRDWCLVSGVWCVVANHRFLRSAPSALLADRTLIDWQCDQARFLQFCTPPPHHVCVCGGRRCWVAIPGPPFPPKSPKRGSRLQRKTDRTDKQTDRTDRQTDRQTDSSSSAPASQGRGKIGQRHRSGRETPNPTSK